ncbi:MAG: hypothetical protein DWH73_03760 [Planctomycetota bacterium]|nr:MAG: hypothetical protein DWH73_03760 [Planctomycetota bacterium]
MTLTDLKIDASNTRKNRQLGAIRLGLTGHNPEKNLTDGCMPTYPDLKIGGRQPPARQLAKPDSLTILPANFRRSLSLLLNITQNQDA